MSQPTEGDGQILVFIIDETYDTDEENYEVLSQRYQLGLVSEFGLPAAAANVGPNADLPAFAIEILNTQIPLWTALLGAFFAGKSINENLDAWSQITRKLRRFFGRPVILARHGASVLAIEAIFDDLGGMPKTIRLLTYRPGHIGDDPDLSKARPGTRIEEGMPTINLCMVRHIFEIEADGQLFRASVEGTRVKILRIPSPEVSSTD